LRIPGVEGRVSGFLLQDEPPETLAAAVRAVAAGDALLAPGQLRRLLEEYVSVPSQDMSRHFRS
jgi:DNA-binding NarL/FixJ family response regulator